MPPNTDTTHADSPRSILEQRLRDLLDDAVSTTGPDQRVDWLHQPEDN